MKHATLSAAAAVVVLSSAFVLVHAARNRSGEPEAEIVLSERELSYYGDPDDSGVALTLRWVDPGSLRYSTALKPEEREPPVWLSREKLTELGFDCSLDPSARDAYSFYGKQSARTAFVALEYDGPAWQKWIDLSERMTRAEQALTNQPPPVYYERQQSSRLAAVDAARDAAVLRARHPDRSRVLIVPAVIRVAVSGPYASGRNAYLNGYIQEVPALIHVPRPLSDAFRAGRAGTGYYVRLRYGRYLEPWVVAVQFRQ
jgi:hypothetical protein